MSEEVDVALPETPHLPVGGRSWQRWVEPARRIGWVGVDQAISSLSNAGLSFFVAHQLGAAAFGAFAVAFTVCASLLGISQAAGANPFTIRYSGAERDQAAVAMVGASSWPLAFGLASGVVSVLVGLVIGSAIGDALIAVGCFLPVMFVQDCWRQILITRRRPRSAVLNDLAWAVVQFAILIAMAQAGVKSAWLYVVAWGTAAAVGAAIGVVQLHVLPRFGPLRGWLNAHKDLSVYLGAEWLTILGAVQLTILLAGFVAGVKVVGSLRGGITLLGPLNVLAVTATTFAVPELSRRRFSFSGYERAAAAISSFFVALTLVWGTILLLLPTHVGVDLLGRTWPGTRQVLPGLLIYEAASLANLGPFTVMRGLGQAKASFLVNLVMSPLLLASGVAGVLVDGAVGAAFGMGFAALAVFPLWLIRLRSVLHTLDSADVAV